MEPEDLTKGPELTSNLEHHPNLVLEKGHSQHVFKTGDDTIIPKWFRTQISNGVV